MDVMSIVECLIIYDIRLEIRRTLVVDLYKKLKYIYYLLTILSLCTRVILSLIFIFTVVLPIIINI